MYIKISDTSIQRESDGACIPIDLENKDYQQALEWLKDPKNKFKVYVRPPIEKSTDQIDWEREGKSAPAWAKILARKLGLE